MYFFKCISLYISLWLTFWIPNTLKTDEIQNESCLQKPNVFRPCFWHLIYFILWFYILWHRKYSSLQKSIPWHSSCFQPNICGHALVIYVFIYFVEIHLTMFVICNIITNPFHSIPLFLEQKEITRYRCSGNVILVFQLRRNAFHISNEQDSEYIGNW